MHTVAGIHSVGWTRRGNAVTEFKTDPSEVLERIAQIDTRTRRLRRGGATVLALDAQGVTSLGTSSLRLIGPDGSTEWETR